MQGGIMNFIKAICIIIANCLAVLTVLYKFI